MHGTHAWTPFLRTLLLTPLLTFLSFPAGAAPNEAREVEILGWIEWVWLRDPVMKIKAKMDTGAQTSSLHATIIKRFKMSGKRWVRFEIKNPETGDVVTLVRERQRTVGIVQHTGENDVRPTVMMKICVSGHMLETEFSLAERGKFTYDMLLGRNTLRRFALIDPAKTFLGDKDCLRRLAPPAETP